MERFEEKLDKLHDKVQTHGETLARIEQRLEVLADVKKLPERVAIIEARSAQNRTYLNMVAASTISILLSLLMKYVEKPVVQKALVMQEQAQLSRVNTKLRKAYAEQAAKKYAQN